MLDYSTENLSYSVEDKIIFQNLSIKFKNLGLVGIIGPNASGKSSLARMLAGLPYFSKTQKSKGKVFLEKKSLDEYKKKELAKNIAYLSQNDKVTPELTVLELILLGRIPYHIGSIYSSFEYKNYLYDYERAKEAMKLADIDPSFEARYVYTLSGGELQRCLLARILVSEAPIFILDEFTNSLDIFHILKYMRLFKELTNSKIKKNIFLILHHLELAYEFCDAVILLGVQSNAEKYLFGPTKEVMRKEILDPVFRINTERYIQDPTQVVDGG